MNSAAPSLVLRHDSAGVATLTLNTPASRNALSLAMIEALIAAFDAVAADKTIRVVVLAGEGPAISSGHDLKEIMAHQNDADRGEAFYQRLFARCADLMQQIVDLPKPVIAAVEGVATAAGCQLVAACDLAIAGEKARFALPGVNTGLFCSSPLVAVGRAVSRKHAMEMALSGALYGAGKRKNAVARVWIKPGRGKASVNGKPLDVYFARPVLRMILNQPLVVVNRLTQYDLTVTVAGGGLSGQAGAVRHGISKALTYYEPDLRPALKKEGFLTRDSRVVERKKYGHKKARASFQFSKR